MLRTLIAVLALASIAPGCSLVFGGGRFTSHGAADADASDSGPLDTGPPAACRADDQCPSASYCNVAGGVCAPCDGDGDGFPIERLGGRCATMPPRAPDCDDDNPRRYPGALPICGDNQPQTCGTILTGPLTMADEVGFLAAQPVEVPSGMIPQRVLVFPVTSSEALVFFQINDGRRTPMFARVPLGATVLPAVEAMALPHVAGDFPSGEIWYDAHRESGNVRVGTLVASSTEANTFYSYQTRFDATAGVTQLSRTVHNVTGAGLAGLTITGQPSMVLSGGAYYWGVPTQHAGMNGLVTMGAENNHIDPMGDAYYPNRLWGSVSANKAAAFPGDSRRVMVWNGSLESVSDVSETAAITVATPPVGRAAVTTLRSMISGHSVTAVAIPVENRADLYLLDCAEDEPLSSVSCAVPRDPARSYTLPSRGIDPLLKLIWVSPTAIGLVFVERGSDEGIAIAFAETWPAVTETLTPFVVPTPGRGAIRELDADFLVETVPGAGSGMQVTLAYAYVRQIEGQQAQLFVGGVRGCSGIGHD